MQLNRARAKELMRRKRGSSLNLDSQQLVKLASANSTTRERRFQMVAYSGGVANMGDWGPMVFDLAGMDCPRQDIPALYQHEAQSIVGVSDKVTKTPRDLIVSGRVFEFEDAGEKVLRLSEQGFPWQASVGLHSDKMRFIEEGESIKANGRSFEGPLFYVERSRLHEVSFVALGADDKTSAIAASRGSAASEAQQFKKLLASFQGSGASRREAIIKAARKAPALHRAWLTQLNRGMSPAKSGLNRFRS